MKLGDALRNKNYFSSVKSPSKVQTLVIKSNKYLLWGYFEIHLVSEYCSYGSASASWCLNSSHLVYGIFELMYWYKREESVMYLIWKWNGWKVLKTIFWCYLSLLILRAWLSFHDVYIHIYEFGFGGLIENILNMATGVRRFSSIKAMQT